MPPNLVLVVQSIIFAGLKWFAIAANQVSSAAQFGPRRRGIYIIFAGFKWFDMGYWTVVLNFPPQRLCTIILPWGKYAYQRLPMGINIAPDVFQEKMQALFDDMSYTVKVYLALMI